MLANARIALYSQSLLPDLRADTGLHYDDARDGIAKVYWSQQELTVGTAASELMQDLGVQFERWSAEKLIAREPSLAPIAGRLAGALYYPSDETGDACLFTRRLGEHCRRLGVEVLTNTTVRRLQRAGNRISAVITDSGPIEAEQIVLATGAEASLLGRPLGLRIPVEPVKGYSITLHTRGLTGLPRLPLIDDLHKVVATPLGDRLRVAGTAEFTGYDTSINPRRIQLLLSQLGGLLPEQRATLAKVERTDWACLRPMTPDGVPIIGPSTIDNLWLNLGAGHLGWTFATGMGRMLADMLAGRKPELAPEAYSPERRTVR
jgi:D-amino-acid dehydrogenase